MNLSFFIRFSILLGLLTASEAFSQAMPQDCLHRKQSKSLLKNLRNIDYNQRSDTADILSYHINLDLSSISSPFISGFCDIRFTPLIAPLSFIRFDLLQLETDSVLMNNAALSFNQNDSILSIQLPGAYTSQDTLLLRIYYKGQPATDAQGFGGFYFSGGYAFNLGVGLTVDPHVFGRAWFPCFDNFVEKSLYRCSIRTSASNKAFCGGTLDSTSIQADGDIIWHWSLNQEIPSYLASVAVAPYATVSRTFSTQNGPVPVELAAVAADTNNLINSFVNLEPCLHAYEDAFGPYQWDRVGYVLVPFNNGAMEHATNIAYPRLGVQGGTLAYEGALMGHELSHHWFGDLVTCKTAEDMWLNEGWATYCGLYFYEWVYNRSRFLAEWRANQHEVLHFLHHSEGGYQPVSGVPHDLTYSGHVYQKGAAVAHSLRGYMGDSLFFGGIKAYLQNYAFGNASSEDLRDFLSSYSGINLNPFFDQWVFSEGFPLFTIDSVRTIEGGASFLNTIYLRQKRTGTAQVYTQVPLEIFLYKSDGSFLKETITMNDTLHTLQVITPYAPAFVAVDSEEKLSDAVLANQIWIKNTGVVASGVNALNLNAGSIQDSVLIRFEHHYGKPDYEWFDTRNRLISPNHYWKIDGIFKPGFKLNAGFIFDGRTSSFNGNMYQDHLLFPGTEDSLVMLYRRGPGYPWLDFPTQSRTPGNVNDRVGSITCDSIYPGEYVLARKVAFNSLSEPAYRHTALSVFPNPAAEYAEVKIPDTSLASTLQVFSSGGSEVYSYPVPAHVPILRISTASLAPGRYILTWTNNLESASQPILKK